eukprot:scaffold2871_cov106-Isochrysis_galbana.AAC.5
MGISEYTVYGLSGRLLSVTHGSFAGGLVAGGAAARWVGRTRASHLSGHATSRSSAIGGRPRPDRREVGAGVASGSWRGGKSG